MRKGYKFKLEPTHEQAVLINKTLGCCRWVYNNALDKKSKAFCGSINPAVKDLSVRSWVCPHCGMTHDRDCNAAINILQEGLKIAATKI